MSLRRLIARFGPLRPAGIGFHVVLRSGIDQRQHFVLDRLDRGHCRLPLRAVPLHDGNAAVAIVVGAADFYWSREVLQADFLESRRGNAERFHAATEILTIDNLLAGQMLGVADRFGHDDRVENGAVIKILADFVFRSDFAFALVDYVFDDVLQRRKVRTDRVEIERFVAFGVGAGRSRVVVAAGPPNADKMIHRVADFARFLYRRRVHGAEALHVNPVGPVAPDVEPQRTLVLHFSDRNRIEFQLEAVVVGQRLQQRDRLFAERRVEVNESDLLAFELVEAAFTVGDVLHKSRGTIPISCRRIEDPRKIVAVGRRGEAVCHRENWNLVDGRLGNELKRNPGRTGIKDDGEFALHGLVALDAFFGVVTGLALVNDDLGAADAAIALVEHVQIIRHAVGDRYPGSGERAGAIAEERNVDAVFRLRRRDGDRRDRYRQPESNVFPMHGVFSLVCAELRRPAH